MTCNSILHVLWLAPNEEPATSLFIMKHNGQNFQKGGKIKVVNNLVPPYLCDILPSISQDSVVHDLWNKHNFRHLEAKTERHKNSLFPSIVQMWNEVSNELKKLTSINEFRRRAITRVELNSLYFGFSRQLNIVHAQLRMQCSNLNYHLFNLYVVDSPSCICSYKCEDVNHYQMQCPLYASERQKLFECCRTDMCCKCWSIIVWQ